MLTFYHAPMSRSGVTAWLLEELGVPHERRIIEVRADGGAPEDYRAVHPHKKVPAIDHDGVVITERAAIAAYLCDAFPGAGLAPPIGDPLRGPYLSWLVYADAVIDPCLAARGMGWTYPSLGVSFGAFADMAAHLRATFEARPYAAGDRFTAADISVSNAVFFGLDIAKMFPETPALRDYVRRCQARPGFKRFMEKGG